MARREFRFQEGASDKFWAISLEGSSFTVQFGRTGTDGQTKTKNFGSEAEAEKACAKLIAEKLNKGYHEDTVPVVKTKSKKINLISRPTANKSLAVAKSWKRIEKWLQHNLPEALSSLCSGASAQAIESFERAIGQSLPEDVRESYRIHDGEERDHIGVIFGLKLLSLHEDSLETWRWWKEASESTDPSEAVPRDGKSFPDGMIALDYTNTGWIPVGADAGSNYLGIDLAPGPKGTRGQVINFGRDEQYKCVLARSWAQFLEDMAAELEQGNFEIDEESEVLSLSIKQPKSGHFFNNCMPWSRAKLGMPRLAGNDLELWKDRGWDQ